MRGSRRFTALGLLVLLTAGPVLSTESWEDEGDSAWSGRAGGFVQTGRVPTAPTERALDAYERAFAAFSDDLDLRFKVMEALYFKGYFVSERAAEKRRIFEQLAEMAEETVDAAEAAEESLTNPAAPRSVTTRAHFWAAIAWGLWGMSHSYVASGTKGVAGRIRDHAQEVIQLDEEFADAGGLRLLGRLHTATPKIPLFTGWIDRREGLRLLKRAYEISTRDPRNALFLAEAILEYEPESRGRALELLCEVAARSPDSEFIVEQTETITSARRLLVAETLECETSE